MPLYVYGCPASGDTFEALRPVGTRTTECPDCGELGGRVYGYSMAITQPEVDTRGLFRRFTEASSEMDYAATRVEAATGQTVGMPKLWQQAKKRAAAMTAAGENSTRRQW